jgi:hypothetical protein
MATPLLASLHFPHLSSFLSFLFSGLRTGGQLRPSRRARFPALAAPHRLAAGWAERPLKHGGVQVAASLSDDELAFFKAANDLD